MNAIGASKKGKLSDYEIDAAFTQMASDEPYCAEALLMIREFEQSDWEAFRSEEPPEERSRS